MTDFIFDGERAIQVAQIESVAPYERETIIDPDKYGDQPEVRLIEARAITMISGAVYISDGPYLDIIDLLADMALPR